MAVQGSLLNAQIPMEAAAAPAPAAAFNPVGNYVKGYTMQGDLADTDKHLGDIKRQNDDRASLDAYLKDGGDLSTPSGVDKSLTDLKGKVSSDTYLKLSDHASKIKEGAVGLQEQLQKLDSQQLTLRGQQLEKTLTYMVQPLDAYDKAVSTKGEAAAQAEFTQTRDKVLAAAAQEVGPDGKPVYPPEILKQLAQSDPGHLKAMLATTKYHKDQVDEQFKRSQITRNDALASFDNARAEHAGDSKAAPSEIAKIDADVAAGRITPQQGEQMKAGIVAKKALPADVSGLTPEAVHNAATDYYLNGKMPARLTPVERSKIMNEAAVIAKEDGNSAEEMSIRQSANKANSLALNDLTKRRAMTAAFEKDADKRLGLIVELARKADTTGIPALNRWINAGRVNIAGDVDVNNLNSAMISAQAELAKVLSGSLGNAAVSDSARQEAATIINKVMSVDQIESLVPNIRREMQYKLDSYDEEIKSTKGRMSTSKTQEGDHHVVSPEDQKVRDDDRVGVLRQEYAKLKGEVAKFDPKESATADQRVRKQGDLDAARRELIKLGVKDPDAVAAPAAKPFSDPDKERRYQEYLQKFKKDHGGKVSYSGPDEDVYNTVNKYWTA